MIFFITQHYKKSFLGVEEPQTRKEWMKRGITYSFDRKDRGTKVDYTAVTNNSKTYRAIVLNMRIVNELGFDFHTEKFY